ncbi:hypothetical protein HIM_05950 [Hirsutella minnesotensis 3608]|uniref:Uncharacterized protein n=1 Tax=Hirsutella minnesotensis 3608 TaxID=1043627 RepID=A0A0F7ZNZ3_9HYPO|nr:hypothetical protein HIM_05950 [Hirsutella minnesotensis 3608]
MSSRAQSSTSSSSSSSSTAPNLDADRRGRDLINHRYRTEEWDFKYKELPTENSAVVRFVAYAAGAPSEDFLVKSKTKRQDNKPMHKRKKKAPQDLYWIRFRTSRGEAAQEADESQAPVYQVPGGGYYVPAPAGGQYGPEVYTTGLQGGIPVVSHQNGGAMNGDARAPGESSATGPYGTAAMPTE